MQSINTGDTAWMLVSAAMVLFMTPGLALFYAAWSAARTSCPRPCTSFFAMGLVSVLWALIGYSLAFSDGSGALAPFIGGLELPRPERDRRTSWHRSRRRSRTPSSRCTRACSRSSPSALITGAVAERMKFKAYVMFAALWALFVYSPLAHWVWQPTAGSFKLGALDFAGGTVVHISSAAAALACAIVLGKRKGLRQRRAPPAQPADDRARRRHPVVRLVRLQRRLGARRRTASPARRSCNTHLAAAAGTARLDRSPRRSTPASRPRSAPRPARSPVSSAITPAAGFVEPWAAHRHRPHRRRRCATSASCLKDKFGFDDALDVVGIHGVGGTTGAILTGVFATTAVNAAGRDGLLVRQRRAGARASSRRRRRDAWAFSFVVSFVHPEGHRRCSSGCASTRRPRSRGLDLAEHAEDGYILE